MYKLFFVKSKQISNVTRLCFWFRYMVAGKQFDKIAEAIKPGARRQERKGWVDTPGVDSDECRTESSSREKRIPSSSLRESCLEQKKDPGMTFFSFCFKEKNFSGYKFNHVCDDTFAAPAAAATATTGAAPPTTKASDERKLRSSATLGTIGRSQEANWWISGVAYRKLVLGPQRPVGGAETSQGAKSYHNSAPKGQR